MSKPDSERVKIRIENVEWIGHTDTPERIAERISRIEGSPLSPSGLAQCLKRAGRPDLASYFWVDKDAVA